MSALDLDELERELRAGRIGPRDDLILSEREVFVERGTVLGLIAEVRLLRDRVMEVEGFVTVAVAQRDRAMARIREIDQHLVDEDEDHTEAYLRDRAEREARGELTIEEIQDDQVEQEARERDLNPDSVLEHLLEEEDPPVDPLASYGDVDPQGTS